MESHIVCRKVSSTCLIPSQTLGLRASRISHLSMAGAGGLRGAVKQMRGQRGALQFVAMHSSKARPILPDRFAAVSGKGAGEVEQSGRASDGVGRVLKEDEGAIREESFVSSVGTPPSSFRDWHPADKQLLVVCFTAVMTTGFMAAILAAAIPSLLALKKAARAFEKLADAAREELPGTMAAIRLSGMEISDLTMELNDLGQEISKGVRSSARALTAAEAGIRQIGGVASNVWQEQAIVPMQAARPLVARAARRTRDTLVQTRSLIRTLLTLSRLSSWIGERFQIALQGRTPILLIPSQKKRRRF